MKFPVSNINSGWFSILNAEDRIELPQGTVCRVELNLG